jgi:LPLT family lysophospholipid transporter-like MFS transporter
MNKQKTFRLLLAAQSLSAFGDNAVYSVIMGVLLGLVRGGHIDLLRFGVESAVYANCLFLPYVLCAPFLGWIADRYTKKNVLIAANAGKALGCLLGLVGTLAGYDTMIVPYLLIGLGAAVYSPAKYGIIPELKDEAELVRANAAIEMTTIFSILTGIIGGGVLVDAVGPARSYGVLCAVYLVSVGGNCLMDNTGRQDRAASPARALHSFGAMLREIAATRALLVPVIGTAIFWSAASFVKLNLQTWAQQVVRLSTATAISLLALWLSVGIIVGSLIAGRRLRTGQVRASWIFGTLMGVCVLVMVLAYINYLLLAAELVLLGILGGLFVVPFNAVIQAVGDVRRIGTVIAAQNFFENGAMLLSTGLFWALNTYALGPVGTFLIIGLFLLLVNLAWLRPALGGMQEYVKK